MIENCNTETWRHEASFVPFHVPVACKLCTVSLSGETLGAYAAVQYSLLHRRHREVRVCLKSRNGKILCNSVTKMIHCTGTVSSLYLSDHLAYQSASQSVN